MAELFEVAAVPEPGAVGLDEDEAHAARSAVRVGPDDHDDEVAHLAVRDEGLLAGDDVFIPVANGFGADALQVAAGAGSVMAIAQTVSPATMRGSHFFFCSSLP